MASVSSFGPDDAPALQDLAGRVRHDLGRYLALQCRWTSAASPPAERRAALTDDLLATSRGPAGTLDAAQVAAPLLDALRGRAPLGPGARVVDLIGIPEVAELERALDALAPVLVALRSGNLPDADVDAAIERAIAASSAALSCATALREIAAHHG